MTVDIIVGGDVVALKERSIGAERFAEIVTIRARFDNQVYPATGSSLAGGFLIERLGVRRWQARGTKAGKFMFIGTITLTVDGPRIREEVVTILPDGSRVPATLILERK